MERRAPQRAMSRSSVVRARRRRRRHRWKHIIFVKEIRRDPCPRALYPSVCGSDILNGV